MTKSIDIRDGVSIGGGFEIISGPCSIESLSQLEEVSSSLVKNKLKFIRAGAFKPRTNPESFQGLGLKGFDYLNEIRNKYNLITVSEVMDPRDIEVALENIDIIQVGTRNMYNYSLLKELGRIDKPILLKRGMSATISEWINASEYIRRAGNEKVIMCERGIRTFETYTRNTLDLMTIPIIKKETDLPIIIDPSHGTGRKELILPASIAAKAMGADGIMVEIHPRPKEAFSDGDQSLNLEEFEDFLLNLR